MSLAEVLILTPIAASSMCRFCMKQESHTQPHFALDDNNGPVAELVKLFKRMLGQELPTSSLLSPHFCSVCHGWLVETNAKINSYREVANKWRHLINEQTDDSSVSYIKDEPETIVNDNMYKVELTFSDDGRDGDEEMPQEEVKVETDPFSETEIDGRAKDAPRVPTVRRTQKRVKEKKKLLKGKVSVTTKIDSRPMGSHWNALNAAGECEMCGEVFLSRHLLIGHFSKQHRLHYHFSCESCPKMFRKKQEFDRHTEIHPRQTTFECCGRLYYSERSLVKHQKTTHLSEKNWICQECGNAFDTKYRLNCHMERHGEKKHSCDLCGQLFHMKKDIKLHKKCVHRIEPGFMCDQCGLELGTQQKLDTHHAQCVKQTLNDQGRVELVADVQWGRGRRPQMRNYTGNVSLNRESAGARPRMQCSCCPFTCLRPETLQRHFKERHPNSDWRAMEQCLCMKCFRQFKTPDEVVQHKEKHHRQWQCDICKTFLNTEISLERHRKIHPNKERRFTCEVCEAKFVTLPQMKLHFRRRHTDERPFACSACDKSFADKSERTEHIRTKHQNSEPHACEQCPCRFKSAKFLAHHVLRKHTSEYKYYECPTCKLKLLNSTFLTQHQAIYHPVLFD